MTASDQHQYKAGDKVLWLFTARGGWNPSWWVPATVVKVNTKRITIDAERKDGTSKRVSVKPERLQPDKQG